MHIDAIAEGIGLRQFLASCELVEQAEGDDQADILHQAGQTAVLVTHNEREAQVMADRIGTMHNGRLTRW